MSVVPVLARHHQSLAFLVGWLDCAPLIVLSPNAGMQENVG